MLSNFLFNLTEEHISAAVEVYANQPTSEPRSSIFESFISYWSGFVRWAIVVIDHLMAIRLDAEDHSRGQ